MEVGHVCISSAISITHQVGKFTHLRRSAKVNGRRLKAANLAISSSATLVHTGGFFQLSDVDAHVELCRKWVVGRASLHLERGSVPIRRGSLFSMTFSVPLSRCKYM